MLLVRILIINFLFFSTLDTNTKDNILFISPVKIPLFLSANFGELRIDHFHSGLDIKTQGTTGKEVVATAQGYIYRISVSPGGFGNALYIRHPSGYSTVYAHLDRFAPEIEDFVKARQYANRSYRVTLYPEKDKFPVKLGELIAFSGNSGSSGGPHLHYEIRKSDNEFPVNPLLFDFGADDSIEPVIEKLAVYPINHNSLINNQNNVKKIKINGSNGNYYVSSENEVRIGGLAGFGIQSFDLLNGSHNKCAVYSITLKIDSLTIFRYVMDGFSFNESRYINSHIDYETYLKEKIYIEKTFVLPNDKLTVYENVVNRGVFNFRDNKTYHVEIIVTDIHKNKSTLSFIVKGQPAKSVADKRETDETYKVMPFNKSNNYATDNIIVNIPSGSLYDTIYFSYKKREGTSEMYSDIHEVHNKYTPVHKAYRLSIKPDNVPPGKKSKMLIIQIDDDQKASAFKSLWADDFLSADVPSFGNFYIGIDTVAPVISANGLTDGANLTGRKEIKLKITDELSGIGVYEGVIDGKWALFEYDQKNNLLIYRFDRQKITQGTNHSLTLKVIDNKDNMSFYSCDFTW